MTTNKQAFAIIANVAFEIPKFLAGAFNAYHINKGRMTKDGNVARITPEGVQFFTLREGEAPTAKTRQSFAETAKTAKYPLTEKQGVSWPVGNNGIAWQAGQGSIGQSAFFYALCQLTNPGAKVAAAEVATAKPKVAKPKATPAKAKAGKGNTVTVTA